ncbi:hypothetical protein E5161_03880 [Cohnella pontilimi]|uniref:Glycosyltransferase RgtA/B/C/D-like domain-containing protein n=1 Tax=Cohnella pontilimi TaxID=2564100 RepID=A0A4U0FHR4_9BACL|nr:glycosyltransferase family 39 protein [Cohnella pontilimi]TJY44525.1 hypothetical protein E5161_03880 [Cohnella pontilimi]
MKSVESIHKGYRISNFVSRVVIAAGILFLVFTLFYAFQNSVVFIGTSMKTAGILLGATILILAAAYFITRWLSPVQFIILLVLVGFGLRLAWILSIQTPPISDFLDMRNAALSAARGDLSFGSNEYFSRWVYLLGFTMYEALITKIFGASLAVLKVFNILFNVGTAIVIYFAGSKLFNEPCGRIASLLYAVYIPNIIMCSVLTNQFLSTFLFALGCLFVVRNGFTSKYSWTWIGLLFAIGNMIRPLGTFFVIGFVVFALLFKLLPAENSRRVPILTRTIGAVAVYFIVSQIISYSFIYSGVTEYPFKSQEPYWKFMVGLNQQTVGGWSQEDTDYALKYKLGEERNQAELKLFKERLQDKNAVLSLFVKKFKMMWGSEDASVFWSLYEINKPNLGSFLVKTERVMYTSVAFFMLISLVFLFVKSERKEHLLFLVLLLGYALVHIVIEVQTRYRLDILPAFLILQSYGIYILYTTLMKPFVKKQPAAAGA